MPSPPPTASLRDRGDEHTEQPNAPASSAQAPTSGSRRWVRLALAILAVVLLAGALSPALGSGMRGDDSHVSIDLEGHRAYTGESLPSYILGQLEAGIDGGRPMPIGVTQGLTFASVMNERLPYKLGIVVLALAAVGMLWIFLRRLGLASLPTFLVVCVAFMLSLQFRATHDPVLGYAGTPQMSMLILFSGLWAYLRYLQGDSRKWYVLSLLLAVALVLNYEANPPLVLAFACLHLGHDARRTHSWRTAVPFLAIGAAMTLTSVYTHSTTTAPGGYEAALDIFTIVQVALRQAVSGIPGVFFVSGSQGLLADPTRAELVAALWRAALLGLVLVAALLMVRGTSPKGAARAGILPAAGIGVVLMSCSGLYISLAAQHQQLIGLGGGHLATFAGTLGFVLVAVAAWTLWGSRLAASGLAIAGVALVASGLAFASQYSNLRVVAIERPGIEQRDLTRAALKQGILDDVPPATTVYVSNRDLGWAFGNLIFYGGTIDYLAYLQTGTAYDIRPDAPPGPTCDSSTTFPVQDCASVSRSVAVFAPRASQNGGTAILAEGMPSGAVDRVNPRRITVLARGVSAQGATPALIGTRRNGRPWTANAVRWTRQDAGEGWVRYETTLPRSGGPLAWTLTDPRSAVDFNNSTRTPGQSVRMFGTKHLLP
ncbi:MAG: hypothetical protein JHC84_00990 [Solirubrobacteraceae bacterium]|nr:hypothetical protein [Solirubrobacteraceae bacterium]